MDRNADYSREPFSALEAITYAQTVAFAPMLFQTALALKRLHILSFLEGKKDGASPEEIARGVNLSPYAVGVLADMGLSGRLLLEKDGKLTLSKAGAFLLNDPMTAVNLDFTADLCYGALESLIDSLKNGKPEGLKRFGPWPTIYLGLSQLPPKAQESWFKFDHFYSDRSFKLALNKLKSLNPLHIYDVGGNTGRFSVEVLKALPETRVTILDLKEQIALAMEALKDHPDFARVGFEPVNVLTNETFPGEADVWWMSQFLDCFSEEEIVSILTRVRKAMRATARLCILELFPDRQEFEAATLSLNATSLYFTVLANGNSRFYRAATFLKLIERAGFEVEEEVNGLGLGHTLLILRKGA